LSDSWNELSQMICSDDHVYIHIVYFYKSSCGMTINIHCECDWVAYGWHCLNIYAIPLTNYSVMSSL
jgi:hypothetical protein